MDMPKPTSLHDALAFIATYVETALQPVRIALSAAYGHMLAEDILASVPLPRFDNAAMDGFAVRADDLAPDGTATLRIGQTITAGRKEIDALRPGEAARIMTGAPVPDNADRVIVQEAASVEGDVVHLRAIPGGKPHIRRIGEDIPRGDVLLKTGTRIGPGQLGLLTALGLRSVLVVPRPKVALLSTGNELVDSPGFLERGQIYDTNRPMLARMLQSSGVEVTDLGIAPDDPEAILARLVDAAAGHDLLISSGGASVGFADHLTQIVSRRGFLEFWKLALRPGKPIGFGDIDDCPILLLPGNPFAAAVGFKLIGREIIARLEGRGSAHHDIRCLPVTAPISKRQGLTQVLPGRLQHEAGRMTMVEPMPYEGSASLRSLALCDVMIILDLDQTDIEDGALVKILPM